MNPHYSACSIWYFVGCGSTTNTIGWLLYKIMGNIVYLPAFCDNIKLNFTDKHCNRPDRSCIEALWLHTVPKKYNHSNNPIVAMLLSLALWVQIRINDTVFGTRGDIGKPVVAVIIIVSFVALFTSHSLIVWKLKKQKSTVRPKHQPRLTLNVTSTHPAGETPPD